MFRTSSSLTRTAPSRLDRALSLFTDVRPGEGATALLMLLNIFLLLVCYSVVKTVREPLILLGGGAEVRSYAAAGQALVLIGFVPLYSAFAARVSRAKLLIGVTLFFIAGLELFTLAVTARLPYVGVAFFIWVGIFNVSLIAQFWSFANDLYTKDAGARLFPIVVIGMTAGAPLGSFIAARLFHAAFAPQVILQIAAALLAVSALLYIWINAREEHRAPAPRAMESAAGGFRLVLGNRYLLLIAGLIVLLNLVNTTGEYLVARLLTLRVGELAAAHPGFNKQAYIGAFSGDYQFWVNVTAFALQAVVASRLVKYAGLAGALLALPLIAFGGYAVMSAGVSFSVVRWIKTAENATDYSIMNTARQMLWLPTSRDEKYKAKQAIDTFFVRGGDVLSAMAVYLGASVLHLGVQQFAIVNTVLAVVWIGLALTIVRPAVGCPPPRAAAPPDWRRRGHRRAHGDPCARLGAVDPRSGAGRGQGRQGHAPPPLRADRPGAARADLRAARGAFLRLQPLPVHRQHDGRRRLRSGPRRPRPVRRHRRTRRARGVVGEELPGRECQPQSAAGLRQPRSRAGWRGLD